MADVIAAPAEEQPQEAPQVEEQPQEPFLAFGDGEERVEWKSSDDAIKGYSSLNKNYSELRKRFTQETQTRAEKERQVAEERKKLQQAMEDVQQKQRDYERFDRFVKERPDVYRELKTRMERPADANVAFERSKEYADSVKEDLRKEVEELRNWREEQERERRKNSAIEKLKSKYQDFDDKSVDEYMQSLAGGELEPLLEAFYYSLKGKQSPIEMEEKAAVAAKKKAGGALNSPGGGGVPSKSQPKDLREAAERLKSLA